MAKRGLGRGLEALIPQEAENTSGGIFEIDINNVEPNKKQPRKNFDKEALSALADSIKEHGVVQPIIVIKGQEDFYQIIAGERRWRAARLAGLKKIPVVIRDYGQQEAAEIALVENLQREDLNAIEEAWGYKSLMEQYGLTQEEVSQKVGKSRPHIGNTIRLLSLTNSVMKLLEENKISAGHARAILSIEDKAKQEDLAQEIINKELSVRLAEKRAKEIIKGKKAKKVVKLDVNIENAIANTAEEFSSRYGTKVKINCSSKYKGKIEIEFYDYDQLMKLIDELGK